MTSKEILSALIARFQRDNKYVITNSFIFDPKEWESDFLVIGRQGYTHEIEVKVGWNDFLLDARKYKHVLFREPFKKRYFPVFRRNVFTGDQGPNYFEIAWHLHKGPVPNRFSYACECGLIKPEDIPRHAGLIWIKGEESKIVVRAPQIHSKALDLRDILIDKFYYQAMAFEKKYHNAIKKLRGVPEL